MSAGPYGLAAFEYLEAGWSPIPLPPNKKHPVPEGFTGGAGKAVDAAQATRWVNSSTGSFQARSNIALRLPRTVLGIDADMYEGKRGRETLRECEERWGPLPATWVSTSRDDGSGIRLFRIPEGLSWPDRLRGDDGSATSGVELVRWDHRYCVVMPSMNPDSGKRYGWVKPDGSVTDEEFPAPDDLPELPEAWVQGLTGGQSYSERARADLTDGEAKEWLESRPGAREAQCEVMRRTSEKYVAALNKARVDGGAHDEGRNGVWAVAREAKSGHKGVLKALKSLRLAFFAAVEGRRETAAAESEWRRFVVEGVRKVCADDRPERTDDDCSMIATAGVAIEAGGVAGEVEDDKEARSFWGPARPSKDQLLTGDLTETDNAQRFIKACGGALRYSPDEGRAGVWYTYNGESWRAGLEVRRWAQTFAKDCREVAKEVWNEAGSPAKETDPNGWAVRVRKWHRATDKSAGMNNFMHEAAPYVSVSAGEFDQRRNLLVCSNGTLEFTERSVQLRANRPSDMSRMSTHTRFDESAESAEWDAFLKQVQPDEEVRDFLQKAVGTSLDGSLQLKLMLILKGVPDSGKTTFLKIIAAALGDYGGPYNMQLFREKRDEAARPDLIAATRRRFIFASESSTSQHLHADQLKRIVGDDVLTARLMRGNEYFDLNPAFTPWLATNDYPTVEGADKATWRRLISVPFDVAVPQNDQRPYAELMSDEAGRSAVLAWAVRGYRKWAADPGALTPDGWPSAVVESTAEMRGSLSHFDRFLGEKAVYDATSWCTSADAKNAYEEWAMSNLDLKEKLSPWKVCQAMKDRFGVFKPTDEDGRQVRAYRGVTFEESRLRR
jgi:putative DNA primase/helicase